MSPSIASSSSRRALPRKCLKTTTRAGSAPWAGAILVRRSCSSPVRDLAPLCGDEEVIRKLDVAVPVAVILALPHLAVLHDLDPHGEPAARDGPIILEPDVG